MLRFVIFAALIYVSQAKCPDGFDTVRDGECHKEIHEAVLENPRYAVKNARTECRTYGARPVIIRNQQDQDYWVSLAKESRKKGTNYGNILLGLECNLRAQWQWSDGSKITFKPANYDHELDDQCDNSNDTWAYQYMWLVDPETANWKGYHVNHDVDIYCVVPPFF